MKDFNNSLSFYENITEEDSKDNIVKLLEKILEREISDIKFEGTEEFNDIIEYDFSLLKANIVYTNGKNDEIYLKIIKGGKIKESIFCYWLLLYDELLKKEKRDIKDAPQRAIITQVDSDKNSSTLILNLNTKSHYLAKINLIELRNFNGNNKKYERWLNKLEVKNDEILFIGRKMY